MTKDKFDWTCIGKIADHFANMIGVRGPPEEEYSDPNSPGYNEGFPPNRTSLMPHTNELVCLLVDQEVLDLEAERVCTLQAATDPAAPTHETEDEDVEDGDVEIEDVGVREMVLCAKVVDSVRDPTYDDYHPQYAGWAFVKAEDLLWLYQAADLEIMLGTL